MITCNLKLCIDKFHIQQVTSPTDRMNATQIETETKQKSYFSFESDSAIVQAATNFCVIICF
jgi:hypothetical protein